MPIVTKPNTFTANQIIDANQMNQNFDSIYGLVNGSLDAANLAVNAINDSSKMANEVVIPSKSKGLIYGSDLYSQNWVVAGGLATFSGSPANQIQVNTVSANILQVDATYRHVSVTGTSYTTSALSSTYFLDLQPDGTMSWATTHSAQAGYLPLASVTTNGSGNVLAVTDVRVLSAGIAWINLSKVSSSLADLAIRSAADLSSGTLPSARLPAYTGDVTSPAGSTVNTITPGIIQDSHVNATAAIGWAKINKVGSSLADLATRSATDLTSGTLPVGRVPTAIPAPSIGNGDVDNTKLSYLNSVTSNVQTQLNAKSTTTTGTGNPNGVVTATSIGQLYTDTNTGTIYTATALNNTSWIIPIPYNAMTQQAIINAALEIWQQGTTFTNPASNAYTADMWVVISAVTGTLPTIVHSQATLTVGELPNAKYAYNINVNGVGSGFGISDAYGVSQRIEFGTSKLCGNGKKVTVSFYAKSNIASKRIAVSLTQNYGTGGTPSSSNQFAPATTTIRSLTTTMSLYTFTFTTTSLTGKVFGTNNDDYLRVDILELWGSTIASSFLGGGTSEGFIGAGDIAFTEVVVNAGDTALPYQPKSYAQELFDSQYYYQRGFAQKSVGTFYNTTTCNVTIPFHRQMRIAPALSKIGASITMDDVGAGGVTSSNAFLSTFTTNTAAKFDMAGFSPTANTFRFAKLSDDYIQADARL